MFVLKDRKNNSKRAHQPVKDLAAVKKRGKLLLSKTAPENALMQP